MFFLTRSLVLITLPVATFTPMDPLEQFDVLALPLIGSGLTNLTVLLGLNVLLMSL